MGYNSFYTKIANCWNCPYKRIKQQDLYDNSYKVLCGNPKCKNMVGEFLYNGQPVLSTTPSDKDINISALKIPNWCPELINNGNDVLNTVEEVNVALRNWYKDEDLSTDPLYKIPISVINDFELHVNSKSYRQVLENFRERINTMIKNAQIKETE